MPLMSAPQILGAITQIVGLLAVWWEMLRLPKLKGTHVHAGGHVTCGYHVAYLFEGLNLQELGDRDGDKLNDVH